MTTKMQFVASCVSCQDVDALHDMINNAHEVSYRTFRKYVDTREVSRDFGYDRWLPLKNDYHVSFYKSKFQGKLCYYMSHSSIEYIYQWGKDL